MRCRHPAWYFSQYLWGFICILATEESPVSDFLVENESALRLTVFLVTLGAMASWELASPRRRVEIGAVDPDGRRK